MKRKPVFLITLLTISFCVASAQIEFQRTYGTRGQEILNDIQLTNDGGYIIAGYTDSIGAGGNDGYLIKTDSMGNILWTKTYGGPGNDVINSVKQTNDSGYIFSGTSNSFSPGDGDIYVVKTDKNGTPVWEKTFGGAKDDAGGEVRQTRDGGYIIVGQNDSLNVVDTLLRGIFVIKTDANGDTLWTRIFDGPDSASIDAGGSIYQTHNGGYIIAGSAVLKDSANSDVYLLKIDSSGHFMWNKFIGGPGNDGASVVHETRDSGFVVSGTTTSFGAGGDDFYMVKTDSSGNLQWSRTYGGGSTDEGGYGNQTSDGGYFLIGEAGSYGPGIKNFLMVKTDANGDTLWSMNYAGTSDLNLGISGKQTHDGGFALAGWHAVFHGTGGLDMYIIKTSSKGDATCTQTPVQVIQTSPVSRDIAGTVTVGSGCTVTTVTSTVSSGGTMSDYCFPTAVDNHATDNNALFIYPNPAEKELRINIDGANGGYKDETSTLYIMNTFGQMVLQSTTFNLHSAIDVSSFSSGIYFVKILNDYATWTGKFIKE